MAYSNLVTVFSVLLVLGIFAHTGLAISCFVCNSHKSYDGQECLDLTQAMNTSRFYKDCSLEGNDFVRCRVQVQDIGDDDRVIRSCAKAQNIQPEEGCIDRTGTHKIKLRYCECNKNGCNSAAGLYASVATIIIATIFGSSLL